MDSSSDGMLADIVAARLFDVIKTEFAEPPEGMDVPTHALNLMAGVLLVAQDNFIHTRPDEAPVSLVLMKAMIDQVLAEVYVFLTSPGQSPEGPASAEAFRD